MKNHGVISELTRRKSQWGFDVMEQIKQDDEEEDIGTSDNGRPRSVSLRFAFLRIYIVNIKIKKDKRQTYVIKGKFD